MLLANVACCLLLLTLTAGVAQMDPTLCGDVSCDPEDPKPWLTANCQSAQILSRLNDLPTDDCRADIVNVIELHGPQRGETIRESPDRRHVTSDAPLRYTSLEKLIIRWFTLQQLPQVRGLQLRYFEMSNNLPAAGEELKLCEFIAGQQLLETIRLNENHLTDADFNCRDLQLTNSAIRALKISGEQITTIPIQLLKSLPRLEVLRIQNNRIEHLGQTLQRLQRPEFLQELDLSGNRLSRIQDKSFQSLYGLRTLELAGNKISTMEPNSLRDVKQLQWLDLSNNLFNSIDPSWFSAQDDDRLTLYLSNNPIRCEGQKFLEFQKWLLHNRKAKVPDIDDIHCYTPDTLRGRQVTNISITTVGPSAGGHVQDSDRVNRPDSHNAARTLPAHESDRESAQNGWLKTAGLTSVQTLIIIGSGVALAVIVCTAIACAVLSIKRRKRRRRQKTLLSPMHNIYR